MNSKSFIIIEDEMIIALDYKMALDRLNQKILGICDNYESACEKIIADAPDYAIVDIHLKGDRDGIEVVEYCKERNKKTKYIFITGNFETPTKKRAEELHPLGFFIKPVQIKEVLQNIESGDFSED
jgi:two-component SAPR family response regulator